jgi:RNA polymerase sigma-70 factor (ECF subfamily)
LPELAVEDLYLAFACACGVAPALEAFTRTVLGEVDAHVAHVDGSAAFKDDVRAVLAAKLLVAAPGATPAIADYAGRAPLSAWVRIAAIRAALNLRRGKAGEALRAAEREIDEIADAGDVELDAIRRRYRPAFEAAIAQALSTLPVRDRTLLRLRLVEGVEVDAIATMYRVHRTTVTRWLADSRATLFDETRRILTSELGQRRGAAPRPPPSSSDSRAAARRRGTSSSAGSPSMASTRGTAQRRLNGEHDGHGAAGAERARAGHRHHPAPRLAMASRATASTASTGAPRGRARRNWAAASTAGARATAAPSLTGHGVEGRQSRAAS